MAYINDLLAQRGKRSDTELAGELEEALSQAISEGHKLSDAAGLVLHCCTVTHCDGLEAVEENQLESIAISAIFARDAGLVETANIVDKVVRGEGAYEPVSIAASIGSKSVPLDLPEMKWGAFDIMLSLSDEDFDKAILDFVAKNIDKFRLSAPASVVVKEKNKKMLAKEASGQTATQLLQALLAHRKPRLRCYDRNHGEPGDPFLDVSIRHEAEKPASARRIGTLRKQYGEAASALLDVIAVHDGASLFVNGNEAAIYLLPSSLWAEHMERVMDWAQDVTWQVNIDEIPAYLKTAIPFAWIPGDYERWLFITEGEHTGKVMLSDTDVLEDEPRFESLLEFMATLIMNCEPILGCGGHISYDQDGGNSEGGGYFYPKKYLFNK